MALIGSSRGGNSIRSYLKNGGGAEFVSHAVLCGTPNKGIVISKSLLVGSEFNGAVALPQGPEQRSRRSGRGRRDDGDPLRQGRQVRPARRPLRRRAGKPTGVGYDATELRGAKNVVLDGLDHREVAFHKLAFAAQYEFITGKPPATLFIAQEPNPVLTGRVTGLAKGVYTNLPVEGAEVEIYDVDAKTGERRGSLPAYRKTTAADGWWGPFTARADTFYEFVLRMPGAAHHPHLSLAVPALDRSRASPARRVREGRRPKRARWWR